MQDYTIQSDVKFGPLQRIDIAKVAGEATPWFNQALCLVNDCVVRLGVIEGEFTGTSMTARTSSSMWSKAACSST